jgi:hypothetical protein
MVSVPGRVSTSLENDWPANPTPVAWRMRDIISIPRQIDRQVLGGKGQDFFAEDGNHFEEDEIQFQASSGGSNHNSRNPQIEGSDFSSCYTLCDLRLN